MTEGYGAIAVWRLLPFLIVGTKKRSDISAFWIGKSLTRGSIR
jgi:hypothetical protein